MDSGTNFVVRQATPDDLVAVLGVFAQRDPSIDPLPAAASERERATWDRMMDTADLTMYLAEVDGQVVGTATLLVMPTLNYECAPTAFVEAVVVAHPYRRMGIARSLMQRILANARAAGCNKIQLLSHKRHADDGAHALYEGLGFEAEAEGFRLYLQP